MSVRGFLALFAVTVVSVGLAAWALATRDVPVATLALDRPLLPELAGKVEEVAEITVRTAERTMTARRMEEGWVLAEAADYPVDPEQVRGIVLGLAEMRLVEAKTDNPERLARLELEPVDAEDAKSRLVTLRDASGRVLAGVVLGKRKFSLYGPGKAGMYVRLADSNQAWLADRAIDVPEEPLDWLERRILDLPEDRIAEVVLQPATAGSTILRRTSPAQERFVMVGLPAGRELDAEKVGRLVGAFGTMSMLDIAATSEKQGLEPRGRAVFRTFAGPEVDVAVSTLGEGDDAEWWLALEVREGKPRFPAGQDAEATQDEAEAGTSAGDGAGAAPELDVAALRKRFEGRLFKVSRYIAERFTWTAEDLLKPVPEESGDGAS